MSNMTSIHFISLFFIVEMDLDYVVENRSSVSVVRDKHYTARAVSVFPMRSAFMTSVM